MSKTILKGLALSAALVCANVFAAFDADYDVSNWAQVAGSGAIDLSNAPLDITLTSGDNGSGNPGSTILSIAITASGSLSFNWNYTTSEINSYWDPFSYVLNGTATQLTTDGFFAGQNQSGNVSIAVTVGDIFEFNQATRDNVFGSASTTVSNFSAPSIVTSPVPLPPSIGLLGFALGGFVMMQRREKK